MCVCVSVCVCVLCAVGKVNKVCRDHIGLLVLGVFNASIPASEIRNEFSFAEEMNRVAFHSGHAARPGEDRSARWKSWRDEVKPLEMGAHVSFVCTRYVAVDDDDDDDDDDDNDNANPSSSS